MTRKLQFNWLLDEHELRVGGIYVGMLTFTACVTVVAHQSEPDWAVTDWLTHEGMSLAFLTRPDISPEHRPNMPFWKALLGMLEAYADTPRFRDALEEAVYGFLEGEGITYPDPNEEHRLGKHELL